MGISSYKFNYLTMIGQNEVENAVNESISIAIFDFPIQILA
jgi:hypothetical protein